MRFKTSIIKETIELEQDGDVVLSIPFTFDSGRFWQEVNKRRVRMATAKTDEDIGKNFIEMLALTVGEKGTSELIEYYKGNYVGMITDIAPLFLEVIYPACDAAHKKAVKALKKRKFRA